ncbi:MAG: DNA mismatch repair endonuclease MutL [Acidobacteria bacterium]|nr:DNA mismatch repair endonuclease MutL [Acidobacteriota bacterium]
MSHIRILPEILANKIAAGEIVERPASIVKELLENAIDAGAKSIHVSVGSGGKRLVLVRDDGQGMSQDDAILAFEHHATSKIRTAEDLAAIATLGFRGEALPSIAAVSRLILKTRAEGEPPERPGTEVQIQGGTVRSVRSISWDRGTEVTVHDVFYNVPARRKFLRSNETELGHITRLVTQYALAYFEIRFRLESEGRVLMDVVPVPATRDRVFQLFGAGFLDNLAEVAGISGAVEVHGFASRPHEQRTNPYSQFFYVNRRMVRDRVITSAVRAAYHNVIPASAYPVVLLFIQLPFDEVDVNAHPAKIEIRFRQQGLIHDLVRESIRLALVRSPSVPPYGHRAAWTPGGEVAPVCGTAEHPAQSPAGADFGLTAPPQPSDGFQRAFQYPFREVPGHREPPSYEHRSLRLRPDLLVAAPLEQQAPVLDVGRVRILGQIHDSYIIACDPEGLLIVDQHVAHERVLYEKLASARQKGGVETQGLLVPRSIEIPPHQRALLDKAIPELARNGFVVEHFGGSSVVIRSVPALAGDADCERLLSEILEGLEAEDRTLDVERMRDRIAVSTACHAAIKVHTPLTMEKMRWLLDELGQTRIPTSCPHGRPIVLRFSLFEIERNFGRI